MRISKNTPATTMVELWRRAETGVGPSIADGSQGWSKNWADFPTAAIIKPAVIRVAGSLGLFSFNTSRRSQELW